jgi:hypothetical protein
VARIKRSQRKRLTHFVHETEAVHSEIS